MLIDEDSDVEEDCMKSAELMELNQDIIYILDDIADDFKINASIVKLIYIVYLETTQGNDISTRALDFVPKQLYKQVIAELQNRLAELIGG